MPRRSEPHGDERSYSRVADYSGFGLAFDAPMGPEQILPISDDALGHIEDGHLAGAGVGKDEFPAGWQGDALRQRLQRVIDNPQAITDDPRAGRVRLHGLVEGVEIKGGRRRHAARMGLAGRDCIPEPDAAVG